MSRTTSGSLTGSAAATELAEMREHLRELEYAERQKKREELKQQEIDAIWDCIDLEGKESFFAWYSDDDNVPNHGTYTSRIKLIKQRIEQLKGK